jgi:ornithine decarboxylase
MTPKIEDFLATQKPETPFLVVDLDIVENNFIGLRDALPIAQIFYAVKANPAEPILKRLIALGSNFDTASIHEIDSCLAAGADPARISYGNTIKKARDIAAAYDRGIRLFAFDSETELDKLAEHAPGSKVFCRILMSNDGAEWPLSRKFGCEPEMARDLMVRAAELGMDPFGLSFHIGSQQKDLTQWDVAIGKVAMVFTNLREAGINLRMVNLGGGFPAQYRDSIPEADDYTRAIMEAMTRHFGNDLPDIIVEPGRSIPGDAGLIDSEVVLISTKSYDEETRWVYLDIGQFGGLAETMGEAIKYRIRTPHDGTTDGPVAIAGPTCDGADIMYERCGYRLPQALKVGDHVQILSTGAYTTTYSAVNFNGFPPLKSYYI